MNTYFEHEDLIENLDDSFSYIGGGRGGAGTGRMGGGMRGGMGAGRVVGATPQQRHIAMVKRYYRHNPNPYGGYIGNRRFGITPVGRRWFGGGGGYLFGYPYNFWYPFFYAINSGDVLEEARLREKYNISDEDWNRLVSLLISNGFITYY